MKRRITLLIDDENEQDIIDFLHSLKKNKSTIIKILLKHYLKNKNSDFYLPLHFFINTLCNKELSNEININNSSNKSDANEEINSSNKSTVQTSDKSDTSTDKSSKSKTDQNSSSNKSTVQTSDKSDTSSKPKTDQNAKTKKIKIPNLLDD